MSGRAALLALLALLATAAVVFGCGPIGALRDAAPDGTLLDMEPRSAGAAMAWIDGLGAAGRALCARHLWWDGAFLLVHATCSFVLLRAAAQRLSPRLAAIAWLPIAVGVLDVVENALVARMLAAHPAASASAASASAASASTASAAAAWLEPVTGVKLLLVPVVFGALIACWAAVLLRRRRRVPAAHGHGWAAKPLGNAGSR